MQLARTTSSVAVLFLTLICTAQAGLLGGIVAREESDSSAKPSDDSPSQSVGLLSGVGGISHDNGRERDESEGTASLLLAGIGGISTRNQGNSQSNQGIA